jgi:hypothetical protein
MLLQLEVLYNVESNVKMVMNKCIGKDLEVVYRAPFHSPIPAFG